MRQNESKSVGPGDIYDGVLYGGGGSIICPIPQLCASPSHSFITHFIVHRLQSPKINRFNGPLPDSIQFIVFSSSFF